MSRLSPPSRVAPIGELSSLSRRRVLFIFSGLMLGLFLAALDQTIIATALPTIARDLGDLDQVPWVATSYLVASTVSVPLYGKVGDLLGRKGVFQAAILIFVGGSIACGASQTMFQLIFARALQGIGGGGLLTLAQSILGDLASPRERGRYLALFGAVWATASIVGPSVGGFLTEEVSWRWIFYINLPVGAAALTATALSLHLPYLRTQRRIDFLGAFLLAATVICTMLFLVGLGGSSVPVDLLTFLGGLAAILFVLFIVRQRRAPDPILPLRLFGNPVVRIGAFLGFFVGVSMFLTIVYLPLYLQLVVGVSVKSSGFLLTPMLLTLVVTSMVVGRLISKTGRYRIFPIVGTALLTLSYLGVALATEVGSASLIVLVSVPISIGIGCTMQVVVLAVQNAASSGDLGVATSTERFFRAMGSATGVAVAGVILSIHLAGLAAQAPSPSAERVLKSFTSGEVSGDLESSLRALPSGVRDLVADEVGAAIRSIFLVAVPLAAAAFVASRRLKETPLRKTTHATADADGDVLVSRVAIEDAELAR